MRSKCECTWKLYNAFSYLKMDLQGSIKSGSLDLVLGGLRKRLRKILIRIIDNKVNEFDWN